MALTEEQVKRLTGLSSAQVSQKLKTEGYNELPHTKKKSIIKIGFDVVREPMFILLVACGILYLILGDFQEAMMLLGFVFVIIGITVYQQGKTENALNALRDLSSPRALVIRDDARKRIPGREVVTGDILILAEGDRVPADGILLWGFNLSVDESILTGESVPVRKLPGNESLAMQRPSGEDKPYVYSGTIVVHGQGIAIAKAIGINTEIGKIGKSLQQVKEERTLIQQETGDIVKAVFVVALMLSALVIVVYGFTRHNWLSGFLSGITLAMAMLPEEFPVVLTIFLVLGAWRISKNNVLTRKIAAIETLGAATVLCVDKTGTLTQNKMSIKELFAEGKFYNIFENKNKPLPENFHELIEYGILASRKDPFDPMEQALKNLGATKLYNTEHIHEDWQIVQEYPLSQNLLALSQVWMSPDGNEYFIAAKGAPEAIADLCHFDKNQLTELTSNVEKMAALGLRVIGIAKSSFIQTNQLPELQHDFPFEMIGLTGLEDPIRPTVPVAVEECYRAGIRVVMITGDYPVTACNIAQQIGLSNPERYITGPELEKTSLAELKEKIKENNIFARVIPEQKLMIVNALKENREIVAMTGDGVNDAPALKSSHIGIAMGERGTDVARESASLVLLDDDFTSIVKSVRMGRRIFDNLRKAMAYIISVHIPIAGMSLIPIIFQWQQIVLYPVHIVFLELIIDPVCSIVFESEPEEKGIMRRKPRRKEERLFDKRTLLFSTIQGLISLLVVLFIYRMSLRLGQSFSEARTLSFITLIISNLCLILTNRSWTSSIMASFKFKNNKLIWVLAGALLFLGLVVYVPFLQKLFHFSFMHWSDIVISTGAGIVSVLWFEILKPFLKQ
jgi:P-type Ca2+ transporter type 2C